MSKQVTGGSDKSKSFTQNTQHQNVIPVSLLRPAASPGNLPSPKGSSTAGFYHHQVSFDKNLDELGKSNDNQSREMSSSLASQTCATMDDSKPAVVSVSSSDSKPVPHVSNICTSSSHGLSTISEKNSTETDEALHNHADAASRTSSSCSMPEYLYYKLSHPSKLSDGAASSNVLANCADQSHLKTSSQPARSTAGLSVAKDTVQASSSTSRLVKETCISPASTSTSESYQLSNLPPLPAKLATLNKPSSQALLATALRSRKARHSIDVRALPSYLARKRQSTFGQFLSAFNPTRPDESSSSDDPLFSEPVAPTLSLGERVAWVKSSGPEFGVVKWIGRMPQITIGWTVGVEFDNAIGNGDGTVEGRRYFVAKENFAKFLPLSDLTKVDNYAGRPRSGTMLSRMSVQLKPGQLISIQRSPTANVPHCYLNAPHHVGHDVHSPNNRHCQCQSCNHPCAHICKTRKPKGKKWTDEMAHMCHFSSKPHAHMCCGGEDLPSAAHPIMEPGISWKHSEVISSLRTVPTEPRRKSVANHSREAELKKSPRKRNTSPNYVRDNCNTAFLQRSGSDLSISSLPSTSSVAEVYIGRSVLTDESDIDSETERSLESSSKAGNKPGFRSLVACFLANSLRLKKPDKKPKPNRTYGNGNRSKKSSRGDKDRIRSHHSKQNRFGLSSTDGDSYADTPQPLTSLSSDVSRHANEVVPISRPSALYSSPKYASCNSKNFKSSKNSPCRINEFIQQHHIDGHISEEATSSSSAQRFVSVERSDSNEKRPSTNASSENAASPRRRRNKGPAPKPPVHTTRSINSSSPLSTNVSTSCPSSLPQSPSNASMVTTASSSTTSKKQAGVTKASAPLSPHLTRSLSEQKQLNMKNMINAMPSFRSEINLQDINQSNANQTAPDDLAQIKQDDSIILVYEEQISKQSQKECQHSVQSKMPEELIYETPMSIKACLGEVPPALPDKTFDSIKMFGCGLNPETKLLEKRNQNDNSPTMLMNRSKSMPFFKYTCCAYHWKQYLSTIAKTNQIVKCDNLNEMPTKFLSKDTTDACNRKCCHPMIRTNDDSECDSEDECTISSDLMNALLSPKHSLRYKKSKDNLNKKAQFEQEDTIGANLNQLCNTIGNYEFIRALSDGSLTNTSTTTVVEFINDDDAPDNNKTYKTNTDTINSNDLAGIAYASMIDPAKTNGILNVNADQLNRRCLSDVFCQTNFNELPERPTRRYKHYKHSCRCRHPKNTSHDHVHSRHCRSRHNECCPSAQTLPCFAHDIKSSMLTSSPSDHSLSSLSSSTSTLSEASTMRTSSVLSNDASSSKPQSFFPSISPFGDSVTNFSEADINIYKEDPYIELISGRSPISTERLFKSAENNFEPLANDSSLDRKSATTFHEKSNNFPLNNTNSSSELNTDMFMNSCLSGKVNNGKLPSQAWTEESQIKCLMSELELAISLGNHHRASILAKELAIKRANCSLTGKKSNNVVTSSSPIVAYLYIEDRNAHRGPIPFQVYSTMSVNMLKLKVEKEFGIPSELQKWVLGRTIATNLNASLSTYGITNSGCPIFLYVLPQHLHLNHNKNNIQLTNEIQKTNGNLSDDDNIYESLRPLSATSYSDYNNIDQQQQTNSNSGTLTRKNANNFSGDNGCNSAQNALATLNLNSGGTNTIYLTENKYPNSTSLMAMPTASDTIISNNLPKNQNVSLLQNYYYQEGEIPFTDDLVFEGLSLVNELLPRVDEENEDELEEEEQLTAKEVINISGNNNLDNVEVAKVEDHVSTYQKLIELEETKCVVNNEPFECPICLGEFKSGEGVVLRECLHIFCRDCLNSTIKYNEEVQVKCPFRDNLYSCGCYVQDREIRELATPEIYERYLRKSVTIAEKNLDKSFHCKTVDCPGWCIYDDNVNLFNCPACQHTNCINCQAVHEGVNCKQYQEELEFNAANSEDAKKTKQYLEDMINREDALRCPQCKVIVMKKWGCDWVKCSMCETEICWITKGFRWGPKGKGDTSGGCRCMINGQRCHPNCKYCH